jgi:hypothetical protein
MSLVLLMAANMRLVLACGTVASPTTHTDMSPTE